MILAGRITVNRMPAEVGQKVGPGDEVLSIDGQSTRGWSSDQLEEAMRRGAGPTVTVVVRPRGRTEPVVRRFTRTEVHVSAASRGLLLTNQVGYLVLRRMSQGAAEELRAAVDTLVRRRPRG